MRPQRRPEIKLDVLVPPLQLVARGGQVALEVHAGREKIRNRSAPVAPARDASIPAGRQIRLGQLQEAALDDRVVSLGRKPLHQLGQVSIGSLLPAAMGDQRMAVSGLWLVLRSESGSLGSSRFSARS